MIQSIMIEKYKNLPDDDQVNEVFDQETGMQIYNPYDDEIYKEWQARNLDSNYFRSLHLHSIFEEKKVEEINSFGFGDEDIQKQLSFIHEKYLQAMVDYDFVQLTYPSYSKYHKSLEFYLKKMSESKELLEYEVAMLFVLDQYKVDIITKESIEAVFEKIDFLNKRQNEIKQKGYKNYWEKGGRQESRFHDYFHEIIKQLITIADESIHIFGHNRLGETPLFRLRLYGYISEHYKMHPFHENMYINDYLYDDENINYATRKLFNFEKENDIKYIIAEILSDFHFGDKIDKYDIGTKLGKRLIIENILKKDIGLSRDEIAKKLDELIDLCLMLRVFPYETLVREAMLTNNIEQLTRIAIEQKTIFENIESHFILSKFSVILSELELDYAPEIYHDNNTKIKLAFLQLFSCNDIPFAIKTFFENGAKDADYGSKLSFIKVENDTNKNPIAIRDFDSAAFKSQLGLMLCYTKLGLKYEVKTILAKMVESFKSNSIEEGGNNNDQTKLLNKDTFDSLNRTVSCYIGSEFLGISCYFLLARLSQDLNSDKIDVN
jgi:hypothetical protein